MIGEHHTVCVKEGLALTVRCANAECDKPLFQFSGWGTVKMVSGCCFCGRQTLVKSEPVAGISIFLLPVESDSRGAREERKFRVVGGGGEEG